MRGYDQYFIVRPTMIGTISTIGATAVGVPIDTLGFKDVLAVLVAGALQGSTGATNYLDVKIQESASATGTGALWADITNGAVLGGSFTFSQLAFGNDLAGGTTTGTWIPYQFQQKYEFLGGKDSNRKRYIRAHATLSGTVGLGPKFSVTFLLGRPNDSGYLSSAASVGSLNVEVAKLL